MEYLYYVLYALGAFVALILLLLLIASMRPAEFRIERSRTMNAPPAEVFALVNNFHNFGKWSPWESKDPNLKRTFSGPDSGVGANYHWVGNKNVGEGNMEILESKPYERITIKLDFLKPFKASNTAEYLFAPEGNGTRMTWGMYGRNNLVMKAFGMLMNMDKLVGADFERGLANIKSVVESKQA